MIPVLVIPFLNRLDLVARCVRSIDYPVEKLVLINNGPETSNIEHRTSNIESTLVIKHPNAGVAGSWNEAIKLFPAPWWLLVNNDIEFAPGDLQKFTETVESGIKSKSGSVPACYYGNHGASCFAVTAPGVFHAGLFDENIYPAYLEDCDWSYRCDVLGLRRVNVPGIRSVHGDALRQQTGSCTIMADPELRRRNGETHGRNFEYYRAKWGGNNGEEKFKTPFNDPHWPVWAWRYEPARRAKQLWPG